ncbi:MAG: carbohydrate ABC transporter permease [Spirochaetaceae bacterium]|nr:carbohydrate ABC transporter permease [Spirochaetaceae bacterium]
MKAGNKILSHVVLAVMSVIVLTPFLLTLSMAFKSLPEVMTLDFKWFPKDLRFTNFTKVMTVAPWGRYYINTVLLVLMVLTVQIVTISLAAYAFGRLKFRGKNVLFLLFLVQMMIPAQSLIVPNYMTLSSLKLLDTILAIGVVYFASAYGVFLMRQAFRAIPMALEDSARMEGCGTLRFIFTILLPLSKPSLIAFSLVSVTHHWNEFFWPIIITDTVRARPLTVGLAMLTQATESSPEWTLTATATLIIIAPLFLSFLIFQRKFIDSFISSGIKG